jgi:putative selenate reductase
MANDELRITKAAAINLERIVGVTQGDSRYYAAANRKEPKRIDSRLDTFDCITCDKCLPVCPNAANFLFTATPQKIPFSDWVVGTGSLKAGALREIVVERPAQIANYGDFCNDCGNCDTFCPEYGGPFIKKPNFFGSFESWSAAKRDGFFVEAEGGERKMHGRYRSGTFYLEAEPHWGGWRFEDGRVCVFVREGDFSIERWFAFGPADATGHVVNMEAFHTMRILLESVLNTDRVHQVNVGVARVE